MANELLINVGPGETRVAIVQDGALQEYHLERTAGHGADEAGPVKGRAGHSVIGNIVVGRVQRVLPGMQAAFVDIGLERSGFLGAKEARCLAELESLKVDIQPCISTLVREGETVVVQVIKDPIGDKGARLSANVAISGRLLVLVPNQRGVALSRRIEDPAERERLTALVESLAEDDETLRGAGYIVRTVATGATLADLREDAVRLAADWRVIETRRQSARAPDTIHFDLDPVSRALRDGVDAETTRVLIDDPAALTEARNYATRAMPEILDRIELFKGPGFLFDLYEVEHAIDSLLYPRVPLKCGGWITIETTEALTAIDVNSGSLTDATGLEETSHRVNLDAAAVIGRQLRLRGIGGIVVIDFIHMSDCEHVANVLQVLALSLGRDRVPTQISCMSEFGLVQLTRKRVRDPLAKFLTEPARNCLPGGRWKTVETVANELMRRIEREAKAKPGRPVVAMAAPDVARWFMNGNAPVLDRLRERVGTVTLEAREGWPRDRYDVAVH